MDLAKRVLAHVSRPEYRPVKPRVIAKKLGLDAEGWRDLVLAIKRLVKKGKLAYGANHLVLAAASTSEGADSGRTATRGDRSRRASSPRETTSRSRRARGSQDAESQSHDEADEAFDLDNAPLEDSERDFEERDERVEAPREERSPSRRERGSGGDRRGERRGERPSERQSERRGDRESPSAGGRERRDSTERAVVVGTFRRAAAGHGFVRPRDSARRDKSQDIYVAAEHSRDAASGDVVTARISGRRKVGEARLRGEIIEVVERGTHRFVGVYAERADGAFVQVDGNLFSQPIPVGDPGAKGACEGDKVVIEMVRFPSHYFEGEAVVAEVLGARGMPGIDTLSIIHEFDLPRDFPEDVLEAARLQAEQFDAEDLQGRRDLTNETIITIDPVDARDFDDAISLERLDNGHWRLGVHIADVAHFVPLRSPLDREARERATSVYLPDRVIPMLPEVISNNLASLQPHKVRYARTVEIEFTPEGARVATEVYRSAIRSRHRFAYEEVDEYLANPDAWRSKLTPEVHALVGRMRELAGVLRERRLTAGAIELTLPEVKIDLDKRGKVSGAHVVENTASHQMIEDFMLAANEAVATWLHSEGLLFLRRIHESPELRRLKALSTFVRELGIECESLESRFEIKRVLAAVAGQPMERAVNFAVLKSMQKAHYSPAEEGHYALHSRHYCHFTSPIRRYPDLTVHRLCDALQRGRRPHQKLEDLISVGEHCSEREQRAERAERELIKVKLLTLMAEKVGERFDAVITGVESFGLFAQGVELPAEGMIHVNALRDDYYDYDASTHSLVGRRAGNVLRLGDVIEVEIGHVDVDRRELDLRLVRRERGGRTPKPEGRARVRDRGKASRGKRTSKRRGRR